MALLVGLKSHFTGLGPRTPANTAILGSASVVAPGTADAAEGTWPVGRELGVVSAPAAGWLADAAAGAGGVMPGGETPSHPANSPRAIERGAKMGTCRNMMGFLVERA
ncbi:MAG: hypothetical protein ACYTGR_05260 [Planctomycetota bacterium]|jgi:hypothetical protein